MLLSALVQFCRSRWSIIAAIAAVFAAVAVVAASANERGANATSSANLKLFAVAAAVGLLIRLVGHKESEEQGTFSVSGPQGPFEAEPTTGCITRTDMYSVQITSQEL